MLPPDRAPWRCVQGAQSRSRGGPFAILNGCSVRDAVVVHVPANTTITAPIHILYLTSAASSSSNGSSLEGGAGVVAASAPRLLVVLEEGASAEVVEEFAPLAAAGADAVGGASAPSGSLCNAVAEIELDDGAVLKHIYVQLQGPAALHVKATLVGQGKASDYSLTEVEVGGRLSRHDLGVDQLGEATQTSECFPVLCPVYSVCSGSAVGGWRAWGE